MKTNQSPKAEESEKQNPNEKQQGEDHPRMKSDHSNKSLSICFFVNSLSSFDGKGNSSLLANAAFLQGHNVSLCLINSISLLPDGIFSQGVNLKSPLNPGDRFDSSSLTLLSTSNFDLVWVLSLGDRDLFLDAIELLWLIELETPFVNSVNSLMFLNNKFTCTGHIEAISSSRSFASPLPQFLNDIIENESATEWIAKPPSESMGRGVLALKKNDSNNMPLLDLLSNYMGKRYIVLQERLEKIQDREKRVVIANGTLILAYQKVPLENEHRANLHVGATPEVCELSKAQTTICENAWRWCKSHGAKFIGIDIIGDRIIEINVVNPGGINTMIDLTGVDLSGKVIESILELDEQNKTNEKQK